MPKLLPCPFCGSLPIIRRVKNDMSVACEADECDANPATASIDSDEAIARWNKRAPVARENAA